MHRETIIESLILGVEESLTLRIKTIESTVVKYLLHHGDALNKSEKTNRNLEALELHICDTQSYLGQGNGVTKEQKWMAFLLNLCTGLSADGTLSLLKRYKVRALQSSSKLVPTDDMPGLRIFVLIIMFALSSKNPNKFSNPILVRAMANFD